MSCEHCEVLDREIDDLNEVLYSLQEENEILRKERSALEGSTNMRQVAQWTNQLIGFLEEQGYGSDLRERSRYMRHDYVNDMTYTDITQMIPLRSLP